jgi:hypothetical protein
MPMGEPLSNSYGPPRAKNSAARSLRPLHRRQFLVMVASLPVHHLKM